MDNNQSDQIHDMLSAPLREEKLLRYFLVAYLFALSFTRAFYLPVVYAKFQPTEIVFLCLGLPFLLFNSGAIIKFVKTWPSWLCLSIFGYVGVNLISGFASGSLDGILEACGRGYLVVLLVLVAFAVSHLKEQALTIIRKFWLWGLLSMCGLTLIGYLLAQLGWINETVRIFEHYPYFGTIIRTAGFTGGSGMLVMVSMVMALDAWWRWRTDEGPVWPVILIGIVLALTISKELVLIGLGIFLIDPRWQSVNWKIKGVIIMLMAGLFWLGTHVIITTNLKSTQQQLEGTVYSSHKVLGSCCDVTFIESSYLALKHAGVYVGLQHPILGVGPGRFNHAILEAKTAGVYPEFLPDYDPHSTWVGAFSETGTLGLISLLFLAFAFYSLFTRHASMLEQQPFAKILLVGLLLHVIASVSVDAMNFRHVWVALGILVGIIIPLRASA